MSTLSILQLALVHARHDPFSSMEGWSEPALDPLAPCINYAQTGTNGEQGGQLSSGLDTKEPHTAQALPDTEAGHSG
jgi:hypothetical protein